MNKVKDIYYSPYWQLSSCLTV